LGSSKFQIGLVAVATLVALRVGVGWHFFTQGLKKYVDPNYSSEAFLKQAKGPLAETYAGLLPAHQDFERHVDEWINSALPRPAAKPDDKAKGKLASDAPPLSQWADKVAASWGEYRVRMEQQYGLSDAQKGKAQEIFDQYRGRLKEAVAETEAWLKSEPQEAVSLRRVESDPLADALPFAKERVATQSAKIRPRAEKLLADVKRLETEFQGAMRLLLDQKQRATAALEPETTTLRKFDTFLTYSLLAGGVCLMVGLFTRLAAVGCALFLLSVMGTQPPWVFDALPIYEQVIEFLALMVIAATGAGRWAGLDYFLSCCCGSACDTKP
jgi:uncharacterized membrane protein YphA (DoxX/SURF4 family)